MLKQSTVYNVLTAALSTGGDFAEIYLEDAYSANLYLVSSKIESALSGRDYGVGIRIFRGLAYVYVYTNDSSEDNLIKVAKEAAKAIGGDKQDITISMMKQEIENRNKILIMPNTILKTEKTDFMKIADKYAREYSKEISQVEVIYAESIKDVLIANSEGLYITDKRVRTRFFIEAVAKDNTVMQTGRLSPGASKGFEFIKESDIEIISKEASKMAVTMLHAEECSSGKMPVIIENGFGGVIFHEACGHGLEATFVAKGNSVFAGRIGEKVASDVVTAIDDGTLSNEWGSLNVDDEGTPTRRNVLIENGILKGYMIDKLNGRRMKMDSTGSSRRESYRYAPTSRMTNTFIAKGSSKVEDMIKSVKNGLYCKRMAGGSVDPATGEFNVCIMGLNPSPSRRNL